ncbi:MAG: hypothetical protein PHF16_05765 [Atribacterota bacterium]|nr:hypothetical protein [Atribacterota bacterium]
MDKERLDLLSANERYQNYQCFIRRIIEIIRILGWKIERQKGTHVEKYCILEINSLEIK